MADAVKVTGVRVKWHRTAKRDLQKICGPACEQAARALAGAIPSHVPVHDGVMRASYNPTVSTDGDGVAHVAPNSPFWHWMEYGTPYTPPYRPIENAARSLGLKYEAT